MNELLYAGVAGHVVGLDPVLGQELWRTKLGRGRGFVSMIVTRDHIFAGHHGQCWGLSRAGKILWHNNLPKTGYHTVLLVDPNGPASLGEPCPACNYPVVRSTARYCSQCGSELESRAARDASRWLFVTLNGYFIALDRRNGGELWRHRVGGTASGCPVSVVMGSDKIFLGCMGKAHALDASNGVPVWQNDLPKLGYGVVNLAMFAADGTNPSELSLAAFVKAQQEAGAAAGGAAAS